MIVDINDLASIGQVNDIPPYMLPPEAWTFVENMRYNKGGIEVGGYWEQIFGTPGVAPHFALPAKGASQIFWLYVSLTKAYAYDGTTHTNITRQTAGVDVNYTTTSTQQWNGTIFGGVPILNNGVDVPQHWPLPLSVATKMSALTAWPSTMRAAILRTFGSYLVAFNVTDSGTNYPHLVQWSNPASPGSLPTSWAYSDPTTEGGRKDLPDTIAGDIKDALPLGSYMFIYKEKSIWKMNYIGGQFIFGFDTFVDNVGILAPRCVCYSGSGQEHVVVTNDDIIIHNGNTLKSILTEKQRIALFSQINRDAADTCFLFLNKPKDEIWFCFPEASQLAPSRALVWNYKNGVGACSYMSGITFRNAVSGDILGSSAELWSDGVDVWDTDTGPWSQIFKEKMILSSPANTKFYQLDTGITRDGASFSPTLQREDLGVMGRKRSGGWINDFTTEKMVDAIWPKIDGAAVRVRVGFREYVNGGLTWQEYSTFNPATDNWINAIVNEDLPGLGRAISVEFSALTSTNWRIDGYSISITPVATY